MFLYFVLHFSGMAVICTDLVDTWHSDSLFIAFANQPSSLIPLLSQYDLESSYPE